MTIRAGFSLAAIYFAMSMATAPWQLAFFRFLNGALTGFIPMSTALLATNTPKQYASRYVASLQTAVASGNLLGPALGALLAGLFGIRGAMRVSGTAVLVSALLVLWLVQERHRPTEGAEPSKLIDDFRIALTSPILLIILLINVLASIGSVGIQPILALHVEDLLAIQSQSIPAGMHESVIAAVFMLPAIGFVLTATRWVRFSEKHSIQRAMLFSLTGAGIMSIVTGLTNNIALFLLFFFINGIFIAALRPIAAATIATRVEPDFHGRAFGMQTSAQTLGGLIGPMTGGFIAGIWGNQAVFIFVGVILSLSYSFMKKYLARASHHVMHESAS